MGREITKYKVIYGAYTVIGRETTKYKVIYGAYTVILAGKTSNIRSYTVYMYSSCQA
jgi:hypothetical protein